MAKVEDVMRKAKEAAKQANEKADPVVDSWFRRLVDDPRTPLWAAAILLFVFLLGMYLAR